MTQTNESLQEMVQSLQKSLETAQNALIAAQKWVEQIVGADLSELSKLEKKSPVMVRVKLAQVGGAGKLGTCARQVLLQEPSLYPWFR